jgi:hypothetical protein
VLLLPTLRLVRLEVSGREDPFAAVIRCTADPAAYKPDSEPLDQYVGPKGGIDECAARFSRWPGRGPSSTVSAEEMPSLFDRTAVNVASRASSRGLTF